MIDNDDKRTANQLLHALWTNTTGGNKKDWQLLEQRISEERETVRSAPPASPPPTPMILHCSCGAHIDEGEWATKPHHTHACQSCGMVWRPAVGLTVGVRFLPGFKNEPTPSLTRGGAHEPRHDA